MFFMNTSKAFLFILILLSECAYAENTLEKNETSALQASPNIISRGEHFLLTFPKLHPKNISVRSPSNKWYSIQDDDEGIFIISLEKYNSATELKINSKTLDGITWVNGKRVKEKVFKESGEYLIYMANNLETEPENTFHFSVSIVLKK